MKKNNSQRNYILTSKIRRFQLAGYRKNYQKLKHAMLQTGRI